MEKFKIFTAFYHLSELRSREDLIKGIIENMDYGMYVDVLLWFAPFAHITSVTATRASSSPRR